MRESQTRTIGSHTYQVTQLPAGKARRLLTRLFKVAGPALGKLWDGTDESKSLVDIDMSNVGAALGALAQHLSEDDVEHVFDVLFSSKTVSRQTDKGWQLLDAEIAEVHFAGDIGGMYRLLGFMLEVNYSSFFAGAGGLQSAVSRFRTPTPSASSSLKQ